MSSVVGSISYNMTCHIPSLICFGKQLNLIEGLHFKRTSEVFVSPTLADSTTSGKVIQRQNNHDIEGSIH